MPRKLRSRRRPKKQTRYVSQGIAIGVIASLFVISGAIIIIQFNSEGHVARALAFGFAFFTMLFVAMAYHLCVWE